MVGIATVRTGVSLVLVRAAVGPVRHAIVSAAVNYP